MENYVNTKLQLFKNLYQYGIRREVRKVGVVNLDSDFAELFTARDIPVDNMYTYGIHTKAQVRAENIVYFTDHTEFDVKMPSEYFHISTKLLWEFNVSNILAALCVLVSQQLQISDIERVIEKFEKIPGRLERVPNPRNLEIYVDYAHTEDSLKAVLSTLKKMYPWKKIVTVFWATGDRDTSKRPKMGEIVHLMSEKIIVTDDDTYSENSLEIIAWVIAGIPRRDGENFWIIPNREDAIRTALIMMEDDDILLLAGKWSETVQVTQQWPIPWSDRLITERLLSEIQKQELGGKK